MPHPRLFDIIQEIKENNACTDTMCADLGIIGATESDPDLETFRPGFTAVRSGNTVKISQGWGGHRQIPRRLRNHGGPRHRHLRPPRHRHHPQPHRPRPPAPPAQAIWKYKAIDRIDDQQASHRAGSLTPGRLLHDNEIQGLTLKKIQ